MGIPSRPEDWGPIGEPNPTDEQAVETLRAVIAQLKLGGGQVLLYPGKNRTMVVFSKNSKVYLLTEARDG